MPDLLKKETTHSDAAPGITARVHRTIEGEFYKKEACIVVAYRPDGIVGPGLQSFLNAFKSENIAVVLCLIVESELAEPSLDSTTQCSAILTHKNKGYDFGAWAGTLRALPELWTTKRLYFVNDSIVGPNDSFKHMISAIRNAKTDFVALTAGRIDTYHAQSYFFVYGENALKHPEVQKFWKELPNHPSKTSVIKACEQKQLQMISDYGLRTKILFTLSDVVNSLPDTKVTRFSPTHHAWRELLQIGFPFLKVDLFHRPKWTIAGWSFFFSSEKANLVCEQVRENLKSRRGTQRPTAENQHSLNKNRDGKISSAVRLFGKAVLAAFRLRRG